MRLPGRDEVLDYVENASGQDAEVQKRVLQMLASSSVLREQISDVKRDLYLVGAQVPEYSPDAAFGAEIMRLTQTWVRTVYERKFSFRHFYRSREFFGLILGLFGVALIAIGVLGWRLMAGK